MGVNLCKIISKHCKPSAARHDGIGAMACCYGSMHARVPVHMHVCTNVSRESRHTCGGAMLRLQYDASYAYTHTYAG